MTSQAVASILDQLLHAEQRSLIPRLAECGVFCSWASANEHYAVQEMVGQETEHIAWLVDLINELGEAPTTSPADIRTTSLHYVDLAYMIPRVLEDKIKMIQFYEERAGRLSANAEASRLINDIITRHRTHLATLKALSQHADAV